MDHIDYAVKMIGIDHVGISSDFDGGGGIDGWNGADETFNVTLELVRRGYTEEADRQDLERQSAAGDGRRAAPRGEEVASAGSRDAPHARRASLTMIPSNTSALTPSRIPNHSGDTKGVFPVLAGSGAALTSTGDAPMTRAASSARS